MSVEAKLYVGPYFECKAKPKSSLVTYYGCPESSCVGHPGQPGLFRRTEPGKFCRHCGSPLGDIEVEEVVYPDPYDIIEDALYPLGEAKDVAMLAPNEQRKGAPEGVDDDDEVHLDAGTVDMVAEKDWMEQAFSNELKSLRRHYESVMVKWGVHLYWC